MKKSTIGMTLSAFLFMGCTAPYSEAPIPANFKTTEQSKVQAGLHWKIIAEDLARSVSAKTGTSKTIYVNEMSEHSSFNRAFRTLLISALVERGVSVMKTSASAEISVDINVQLVKFSEGRAKYRNAVGVPTALTAGVWVLRDLALHQGAITTAAVASGTAAIGLDVYNWFKSKFSAGDIPQNEIIVTVSSADQNRYLSSLSNVYYTSDTDVSLYTSTVRGKTIGVEGGTQ